MSKLNNIEGVKKPIKDNRISFPVSGDDDTTLKEVKEVLSEYVKLELINKIDAYKLVNSHIIYIRFSVDMKDNHLSKIAKLLFGVIPDNVKKLTYKGRNGEYLIYENPIFINNTLSALALLDDV
jgi:hypothetical protein